MGSIGGIHNKSTRIGVATASGRAYYRITCLLKHIGFKYVDVLPTDIRAGESESESSVVPKIPLHRSYLPDKPPLLIVSTRRERIFFERTEIPTVCIEDLGDDPGIAKQKIFSILYPPSPDAPDILIVGIDPGIRTGVAVFMNQRKIVSEVLPSIDSTVERVAQLLNSAPGNAKKIVKIGYGIPYLANKIAKRLEFNFKETNFRIELVDERGTSSLYAARKGARKRGRRRGTSREEGITSHFENVATFGSVSRDERAAHLIAFRQGREYPKNNQYS